MQQSEKNMAALAPPMIADSDAEVYANRPNVDGRKVLVDGKVLPWDGSVQEVNDRRNNSFPTGANYPSFRTSNLCCLADLMLASRAHRFTLRFTRPSSRLAQA